MTRELEREAVVVFRNILEGLLGSPMSSRIEKATADSGWDVMLSTVFGKATLHFAVQVRSRITPLTALSIGLQRDGLPKGTIPAVFAPVVSPRTAEILREQGIGYADRAGNCRLLSVPHRLLVERQGHRNERQPTPRAADPFSPRSSRIVRAMLSRPLESWQVRQLAAHPEVRVSAGLVVKVKRALVEEGYAVEREKRLHLRDPVGLLNAWSRKYSGPVEQVPMYFRGDVAVVERTVSRWYTDNNLLHLLAGYSAGWRLAPEVRYSLATMFVEERGFDEDLLKRLAVECGAKRVDTGPNLVLWRPYDGSVFAGWTATDPTEPPTTSALQTYLDLKRTAGRGEDAAKAVFEKHLARNLQAVTENEKERQRGTV